MKNIGLIFGGKSAEHDVSIITATQIYQGYTKEEFKILPIFLSRTDEFYLMDMSAVSLKDYLSPETLPKVFTKVFLKTGSNYLYGEKKHNKLVQIDACINACHGGVGENSKLVSLLDMCNIPCSSGDSCALAVGFDKVISKLLFKAHGIEVLDCYWFYKEEWENRPTKILSDLTKMKLPLIVKPARQGSSIGISVAKSAKELVEAIKLAFEFDSKVLIEKALENFKEYNCSALGFAGGEIITSDIDELEKIHDILTFEDKYVSGGKQDDLKTKTKGSMATQARSFVCDNNLILKIQEISKTAMRLLGLSGVIRVDYLYDLKKKKLYLNEINTIPGSLSFYFWARKNIDINTLIEKLIEIAQYNFNIKHTLKSEYITKLF